jgi:hypothetical protein
MYLTYINNWANLEISVFLFNWTENFGLSLILVTICNSCSFLISEILFETVLFDKKILISLAYEVFLCFYNFSTNSSMQYKIYSNDERHLFLAIQSETSCDFIWLSGAYNLLLINQCGCSLPLQFWNVKQNWWNHSLYFLFCTVDIFFNTLL